MEVPAAGGAPIVIAPTVDGITLSNPMSVAVDAANNLIIADQNNGRVINLPLDGGAATTIPLLAPKDTTTYEALQAPNGVVLGALGNLFVTDSSLELVGEWARSQSVVRFTTATAVGTTDTTDGTTTVTIANTGNQALTFSALAYPADFSMPGSDANACTSTTVLNVNASCDLPVNFTPKNPGALHESITITDNNLNVTGNSQSIHLTGTATGTAGDTTATAVNVTPTTLSSGQQATVTATITDTAQTSSTPTGTVNFSDTLGLNTTSLGSGHKHPQWRRHTYNHRHLCRRERIVRQQQQQHNDCSHI
jgi:hypothetical protein